MFVGILCHRLSQQRSVLLKQQLNKMTIWLKKAEQKMDTGDDIGPTYETVKEQLEEHQVTVKCHRVSRWYSYPCEIANNTPVLL